MRRTLATVTLATLFCAGCTGDSDDSSDAKGSTSRSPGTASGSSTEATSLPPAVGAEDAENLSFADLDASVSRRNGDPDNIVSAFGSIW